MASISNKQYLFPIAILFLVIIVLLTTAIFILTPNIQNDLAKQIQQELGNESISAKITLSGRDVTLSGTVNNTDTKQKAEAITEKICGIRFIDNQLLTEKAENLALLTSPANSDNEKKVSAEATTPALEKEVEKSRTGETSSSPLTNKESIIEENITKKDSAKKKTDNAPVEQEQEKKNSLDIASVERSASPEAQVDNKKAPKRNTLNYETMLAAMKVYQAQKGRNPKRLKPINIRFKKDGAEILPESNTELDNWVTHFQKTNNITTIKITVSAENSTLAINRAKAIRTYFVKHGIEESTLKVTGKSGADGVQFNETK